MPLYLAISNDGQMDGQEMLRELQEYRICPVMTYEEDGKRIVPVFPSAEAGRKFAKRNTERYYSIGTMQMEEKDRKKLEEDGFVVETLNFPKKRKIIVHVMHLDREVQTHNKGWRKDIK